MPNGKEKTFEEYWKELEQKHTKRVVPIPVAPEYPYLEPPRAQATQPPQQLEKPKTYEYYDYTPEVPYVPPQLPWWKQKGLEFLAQYLKMPGVKEVQIPVLTGITKGMYWAGEPFRQYGMGTERAVGEIGTTAPYYTPQGRAEIKRQTEELASQGYFKKPISELLKGEISQIGKTWQEQLPGGEVRQQYEALPQWKQTLAELPAYMAATTTIGAIPVAGQPISAWEAKAMSKLFGSIKNKLVERAFTQTHWYKANVDQYGADSMVVGEMRRAHTAYAKGWYGTARNIINHLGEGLPQFRNLGQETALAIYSPELATLGERTMSAEVAQATMKPLVTGFPTIESAVAAQTDPSKVAYMNSKLVPSFLNKMAKAPNDAVRGVIAWQWLHEDAAQSLASLDMSAVRVLDTPFVMDTTTGMVKNVVPRDPKYPPHILSIAEFPERYDLNLAQKAELDLIDNLLKNQLAKELSVGLDVPEARLAPGQRYFPRFVKEVTDLETQIVTQIKQRGAIPRRPGIKPGSFRSRFYDEVLQGVLSGKSYSIDYRAVVDTRLIAGNKAIADKMLANYLEPFGVTPTMKVAPKIISTAQEAVAKARGITQFLKVANRVLRGETPTIQTLRAQEARFPSLAQKLENLLVPKRVTPVTPEVTKISPKERAKALRALIKEAKTLETGLKEASRQARAERTIAMKLARRPILGVEGTIIHAGLQGRLFPVDISEPTNEVINGLITPHQVLNQLAKINAVARMGQTSVDFGPPLIQGQLTLFNHPKNWGKAFGISLQTLKNPKYLARFFQDHKDTIGLMIKNGASPFAGSEWTEAARPGGLLAKVKPVKWFSRWFESYLDATRVLNFESEYPIQINRLGRELTERELTELTTSIDFMSGVASLNRLGVSKFTQGILSNALYAPRYFQSFASNISNAFKGGVAGNIARKSLAKGLAGAFTFMSALALALGQKERLIPTKEDPVPKMFDPTSGEILTVEIAGVHMGLGGIYVAGMRLLGSIVKTAKDDPKDFASIDPHENPILRYYYGRSSPVASGVIDMATGRNYMGERLDTPIDYLQEVIDKTFPFWSADQITTYLEKGVPRAGFAKGLAEWWGLRAWEINYSEMAEDYANTHIKNIPDKMIMEWQRAKFAAGKLVYEDLNNEQRAWLLGTYQEYQKLKDEQLKRKSETGTDFDVVDIRVREILDSAYHNDLTVLAKATQAGTIELTNYMEQAEYLRRARQGLYQYRATYMLIADPERVEEFEEWVKKNQKPEDKTYEEYMELRGNPPKSAGIPDWEAWSRNINGFLTKLDPETKAYVLRKQDDWINKLPPEVQQIEHFTLDCESILDGYYAVPTGSARVFYRIDNPQIDARLYFIRGLKPRSIPAINSINDLAKQYNVNISLESVWKGAGLPALPMIETQGKTFEELWSELERLHR